MQKIMIVQTTITMLFNLDKYKVQGAPYRVFMFDKKF